MDRLKSQRRSLWLSCLLAAATLAAFWPVFHNGFINYDDPEYVTENPQVRAGLTLRGLGWALTTGYAANWHPLTWVSHMLDVQFFGVNPAAHHAVNLVFHVANSLLLFLLLQRLTGATWRSFLVGCLFAVHPMHAQSVAWVAERKDVLSTLFFLLTLWTYAEYAECGVLSAECGVRNAECRSQGIRGYAFYGASLVLFALGLMSKPMLVTVPFVLLLLDVWPLGRLDIKNQKASTKNLLLEKIPFFALSIASALLTIHFQRAGGAVEAMQNLSLTDRLANAAVSYVGYLEKLFWPSHLAVFYPQVATPRWQVWASSGLIVGFSAVVLLALFRANDLAADVRRQALMNRVRPASSRRQLQSDSVTHARPGDKTPSFPNFKFSIPLYLPVGWFWFVGTLVPVIGLVQAGSQAMADRYTYIPYIGLFGALIWLVVDAINRSRIKPVISPVWYAAPSILIVGALAFCTYRQTLLWHDSETLFRHALAVTPDNAIARFSLGKALVESGRTEDGIAELRKALDLLPGFANARGELASALAAEGKDAEAAREYELTLESNPGQVEALNNLAWLRATNPDPALRNGAEAVRLAERACELTRYQKTVFIGTLAAAYAEAGRFSDAIVLAQKARDQALAWSEQDLAEKNRRLLEFYRANEPYHEQH